MTILIKREQLAEPLDPLHIEEELPTAWNAAHVALRVVEAFATVLKMPRREFLGFKASWPAIVREFEDLVAQQEPYELERTQARQNHVKIVPSSQDIAAMEKALSWPAQYLRAHPELMVATNMIALAHALGTDAGWVAKKRGGFADTWRQRHDRGCTEIALGLVLDRIGVF